MLPATEGIVPCRHTTHLLVQRWAWALVDGLAWVVGILGADWLRYDFHRHLVVLGPAIWLCALAVALQLLIGSTVGPYSVGHQRGSFEETYDVGKTAGLAGIVLGAAVLVTGAFALPRSVPFTGTALALLIMFTARFVIRSWRTRVAAARRLRRPKRVIIFGAGEAGAGSPAASSGTPAAASARSRSSTTTGRRRGCGSRGIRVQGNRNDMAEVAAGLRSRSR